MAKKKKLISMSDEDIELLKALKGELEETGISASQSDIVVLGLRTIRDHGGPLAVMKAKKKAS